MISVSKGIYSGGVFQDESFVFKHDRFGAVSMANRGKDTNSSQFFLCLGPAPWLDGRHVVFGQVLFGAGTLKKMEDLGSRSGKVCVFTSFVRIFNYSIFLILCKHDIFVDLYNKIIYYCHIWLYYVSSAIGLFIGDVC